MRHKGIALVAGLATACMLMTACSGSPGATAPAAGSSPGAAASGGSGKTLTIGLSPSNLQQDFFNQIKESAQKEADAEGIKLVVSDPGGDSDKQVSQIQDFITQKVDAIIFLPAGATAATVPVKAAHAAGIPIVTVDRNPDGAPGDTFIATDSVASAKALGEYSIKLMNGQANIGIIQGQIGTTPQVDRENGWGQAMGEAAGMKQVAEQASLQWAQDEGYNIASDMLQAHPEINFFFGQADALALGAVQAAKAANRSDIKIVGFDGDPAGLQAVKDGTLAATMCQQTQLMGKMAIQSAVKLINGETVPPQQLQSATLITTDNVDQFIANHP